MDWLFEPARERQYCDFVFGRNKKGSTKCHPFSLLLLTRRFALSQDGSTNYVALRCRSTHFLLSQKHEPARERQYCDFVFGFT